MKRHLTPIWESVLANELAQPYFHKLWKFIEQEYATQRVFPKPEEIFLAYNLVPPTQVRVVILGQDPYPTPGHAHGLSFSVQPGVEIPRSLQNIYKELSKEFNKPLPTQGNLMHWAQQGVLLLNTVLTVRAGEANSHQKKGWEQFTDATIRLISEQNEGVVFILWGNPAQKKASLINESKHLILKSSHPSPLSARHSFFGCDHFIKANAYLKDQGKTQIQFI